MGLKSRYGEEGWSEQDEAFVDDFVGAFEDEEGEVVEVKEDGD